MTEVSRDGAISYLQQHGVKARRGFATFGYVEALDESTEQTSAGFIYRSEWVRVRTTLEDILDFLGY